jgi:hypothetical protein
MRFSAGASGTAIPTLGAQVGSHRQQDIIIWSPASSLRSFADNTNLLRQLDYLSTPYSRI